MSLSFYFSDVTLECCEALFDTEDAVFLAFEFDAEVSVVACSLHNSDALLNGNITLTDDRASEEVTTACLVAETGNGILAGVEVHILCVYVYSIRSNTGYCGYMVFICT